MTDPSQMTDQMIDAEIRAFRAARRGRTASPELEALYALMKDTASDINEHLPMLRELASECEHVTEFGMRTCQSTTALLAAQPETLISWDINPFVIASVNCVNLMLNAGRTKFEPRIGDTLKISPIELTDMLFIDSLHTSKQLWAELQRHADPVERRIRKYLVFHDTATFGMKGEDGTEPGLRGVIRHFQKNHAFPLWELLHDLSNNNGLIVLRRVYS